MDPASDQKTYSFLKYLVNCLEIAFYYPFNFYFYFALRWWKASCPFLLTFPWTLCPALMGSSHTTMQRWLRHLTVPLRCCALQSTCLEIRLLQPHGCMTAEQCGHGKCKLLCCTLGLVTPHCCLTVQSQFLQLLETIFY